MKETGMKGRTVGHCEEFDGMGEWEGGPGVGWAG